MPGHATDENAAYPRIVAWKEGGRRARLEAWLCAQDALTESSIRGLAFGFLMWLWMPLIPDGSSYNLSDLELMLSVGFFGFGPLVVLSRRWRESRQRKR